MSEEQIKIGTENLLKAQSFRKDDARERALQAIENLEKRGAKLTFRSVAREANLSVSYLYKYDDIKLRIAQTRNNQASLPRQLQSKTDSSYNNILVRLKERIVKLEEENKKLKGINEGLAGKVHRIHFLEDQIERQKQIIEDLQTRMKELQVQVNQAKIIPITQGKSIPEGSSEEQNRKYILTKELKTKISEVGIKLNDSLIQMINSSTEKQVLNALGVVKERLLVGKVKSKAGLFRSALVENWEPNETEEYLQKSQFEEWYELARAYGIVIGNKQEGDVILVQENTKEWIPYEEFSDRWTVDYLRRVVTGK
ncbi:DUF6262 family protein [Nostoc sphaeroides]|uniref:Transposase C n=1 Tax=Nostoc sphaeroides CCNUC1 TaxID=2653204 RepID=A0A5P8WIU1_9NOSO|nr:DUF6262 family protein [Nostoc sphaeroides]QFS52352.1 Transposase C [Nostoc sphaeroides CCNUC1]